MNRLAMALVIIISAACVLTVIALSSGPEALPAHTASPKTNLPQTPVASTPSGPDNVKGGVLRGTDADGAVLQFPLEHTDVRAEVTGNIAQVELIQIFRNPYKKKIEAVYVFPLPNRAAVNGMEIKIGERTIEATIKKRDDAQRIYEEARAAGHVTALLEQERPNIFTQSVANILPGNSVEVTIRYFETVPYENSAYTFSFPMVVGPRFIPGEPSTSGERGWSPNTTDVPDASGITPPVLEPGQRTGHDISLSLQLDAGATLTELAAPSHDVTIERNGETSAVIRLANEAVIPNKDFVLRYSIDGEAPRVALLPHRRDGNGHFLLLVQPETEPPDKDISPKEMIFVVDGSGSMSGFPIEKVKEAMRYALKNLNAHDTFRIIRFSNGVESFQPGPVPATSANIQQGLAYVGTLSGRGGTIMLEGVEAALRPPKDPERLRIVSFMTDGHIGNEDEILAYLKTNLGSARLFSFGVGNSVNRYLLDKMAEFGRGTVEYVLLKDKADESVARFYDRIRNPYLTDLEIDWGGIPVEDVYPKAIPDLFLGQPVVPPRKVQSTGQREAKAEGKARWPAVRAGSRSPPSRRASRRRSYRNALGTRPYRGSIEREHRHTDTAPRGTDHRGSACARPGFCLYVVRSRGENLCDRLGRACARRSASYDAGRCELLGSFRQPARVSTRRCRRRCSRRCPRRCLVRAQARPTQTVEISPSRAGSTSPAAFAPSGRGPIGTNRGEQGHLQSR